MPQIQATSALEAHAEARVRERAVAAHVEVPLEGLARQLVLLEALLEQREVVDALRAADDLAVALGGEHVEAEDDLRILRVGLHVERLDRDREAGHDQRPLEVGAERGLLVGAEVVAELDREALLLERVRCPRGR